MPPQSCDEPTVSGAFGSVAQAPPDPSTNGGTHTRAAIDAQWTAFIGAFSVRGIDDVWRRASGAPDLKNANNCKVPSIMKGPRGCCLANPSPNNRASRGLNLGDAVLKLTFAELLRSCSRIIGCARTSPSNLNRTKQPPIASWSHRRQNTQTFAACNRDILPRYTTATLVLHPSGTLEE
jgi:hypothetical protein